MRRPNGTLSKTPLVACLLCQLAIPSTFASDALLPDQESAIEAAATRMMADQKVPSVVIMVDRDGKRIFERAWGSRNAAENLSARIDTLYQYGSITKQFTAMCIFLLAQDGKLAIDDPVGKYLPAFVDKPISIRQLLIHTSGTADFLDAPQYGREIAPQLAMETQWGLQWASTEKLNFLPGKKAQYSNSGYVALTEIVETVSAQSFERFLEERIFASAKMRTARTYQYFPILPNLAVGYVVWNKEYADMVGGDMGPQGAELGKLVHAPLWNLRQAKGAGYLVGDAAALQAWGNALLAGKFLDEKWRTLYFSSGVLGDGSPAYAGPENKATGHPTYCYGGLAKFEVGGRTVYGANGETFGFSTFTGTIPHLGISVTSLTNLGDADNSKLTMPVLEALLK